MQHRRCKIHGCGEFRTQEMNPRSSRATESPTQRIPVHTKLQNLYLFYDFDFYGVGLIMYYRHCVYYFYSMPHLWCMLPILDLPSLFVKSFIRSLNRVFCQYKMYYVICNVSLNMYFYRIYQLFNFVAYCVQFNLKVLK